MRTFLASLLLLVLVGGPVCIVCIWAASIYLPVKKVFHIGAWAIRSDIAAGAAGMLLVVFLLSVLLVWGAKGLRELPPIFWWWD